MASGIVGQRARAHGEAAPSPRPNRLLTIFYRPPSKLPALESSASRQFCSTGTSELTITLDALQSSVTKGLRLQRWKVSDPRRSAGEGGSLSIWTSPEPRHPCNSGLTQHSHLAAHRTLQRAAAARPRRSHAAPARRRRARAEPARVSRAPSQFTDNPGVTGPGGYIIRSASLRSFQ